MARIIKWSPIEFELDAEGECKYGTVKDAAFAILKDIEERELEEKDDYWKGQDWYKESMQREYNDLLPYLDKHCRKYIMNIRQDIGFVFQPKVLKGTYVIDNFSSLLELHEAMISRKLLYVRDEVKEFSDPSLTWRFYIDPKTNKYTIFSFTPGRTNPVQI